MKYKELNNKLENIKTTIKSTRDNGNLKEFLREKLHQVGKLLFEYTSPILTEIKSTETSGQKKQTVGKNKGQTNFFSYVNNCPEDKNNNSGTLLSNYNSLDGLVVKSLDLTDFNNVISNEMNNNLKI
jgi:hypothetical protein